ncbi:MAG: metalloregulator ArsR/SmtB family transcription factor [Dehalococcoidia bacterium]
MSKRSGGLPKRSLPFEALAHPTRRAILELLREHPGLPAGEIASHFPTVSRAAVSKHLGILRGARLLRARPGGREVQYTLDPRPLGDLYEKWLRHFEPLWERSLANLKRQVEEGDAPTGG